jgi:hypothetical protein
VYDYAPPVKNAQHMAHLKPREGDGQALLSHTLAITPEPAQQTEAVDLYGNARAFFNLPAAHDELIVVAHSVVSTTTPPAPAARAALGAGARAHALPPRRRVRRSYGIHLPLALCAAP